MALEPPLLPEVEGREAGGEREAGEGREDQPDVEGEERVTELAAPRVPGPAAQPGDREEHRRKRHDHEAEEPEGRPAAPDEVGADD